MDYRKDQTQIKRVYEYLLMHQATASMLEEKLNIKQKCITRYKRTLEQAGYLFVVCKKKCKVTGFLAWYLSTNVDDNPNKNQLKFDFGDE